MPTEYVPEFNTVPVRNTDSRPRVAECNSNWFLWFAAGDKKGRDVCVLPQNYARWLSRKHRWAESLQGKDAEAYADQGLARPLDPGTVPFCKELTWELVDEEEIRRRGDLTPDDQEYYTRGQVRDALKKQEALRTAIKHYTENLGGRSKATGASA